MQMAKAVNQYSLKKQIEEFIRQKKSKKGSYSVVDITFIQQNEGSSVEKKGLS